MNEPFIFYRALDPLKGSWDGYGFFPLNGENDFIAYVTDAPSTASVHTPELIHDFWTEHIKNITALNGSAELAKMEFAHALNRLQDSLQRRSRQDGSTYQATLSVAWKSGEQLLYCAIGDSTLQLLRNGRLYRLSLNEVWDGALIMEEMGDYKERQKTGVPQVIGSAGEFIGASQISDLVLKKEDLVLLNTDGLEDLLAPQRFLSLLRNGEDQMRKELERLFVQDRLKDDVTLVAIRIRTPQAFDFRQELERLQTQIQKVQMENKQLHSELEHFSAFPLRLDKMEKNIAQLNQQLQKSTKGQDTGRKSLFAEPSKNPSAGRTFSATKAKVKAPTPWILLIAVFLSGLILGLSFFLWSRPGRQPAPAKASAVRNALPSSNISPPEITAEPNCSYVIEKGDTLEKVALRKNITLDTLLQLNPTIRKTTPLKVGEKIITCREGL
jgi:serine/threonine protein phosphatase PrpC/LysM repeat protein